MGQGGVGSSALDQLALPVALEAARIVALQALTCLPSMLTWQLRCAEAGQVTQRQDVLFEASGTSTAAHPRNILKRSQGGDNQLSLGFSILQIHYTHLQCVGAQLLIWLWVGCYRCQVIHAAAATPHHLDWAREGLRAPLSKQQMEQGIEI